MPSYEHDWMDAVFGFEAYRQASSDLY
jgi:hypothetical protein